MKGDPRDEIVRKTGELNADVVVLGSRGLGILKRLDIFLCLFVRENERNVEFLLIVFPKYLRVYIELFWDQLVIIVFIIVTVLLSLSRKRKTKNMIKVNSSYFIIVVVKIIL